MHGCGLRGGRPFAAYAVGLRTVYTYELILFQPLPFVKMARKYCLPKKRLPRIFFPFFPPVPAAFWRRPSLCFFKKTICPQFSPQGGLTIFGNRAIVTLLFTPFKCPNCTALLCTAPRVLARGLFLSFFLFFPAHFLHKCPPHDTIHTHKQALPKRAGPGFLAFVPLAGIGFPFCPKPCFRRTAFTRFAHRRKGRCP